MFDTGLHHELVEGVAARYPLMARQFVSRFTPEDKVSERLQQVDIDPSGVTNIVFSHLHFDHCGGTSLLPNARIIVQEAEWKSAHHPKLIEHEVYNPADFDLGHDVLKVEGTHDVFGDGSVVCIPTPGAYRWPSIPSSQLGKWPCRLNGRLCLLGTSARRNAASAFWFDHQMQLDSMQKLKQLRDEDGCRLLYGHDQAQWAHLTQSSVGIT